MQKRKKSNSYYTLYYSILYVYVSSRSFSIKTRQGNKTLLRILLLLLHQSSLSVTIRIFLLLFTLCDKFTKIIFCFHVKISLWNDGFVDDYVF